MSRLPPRPEHAGTEEAPRHPFSRLDAEVAALRTLGAASNLSPRAIADLLGVSVREVERTWRGIEPLSIRARERLADVLHERAVMFGVLERSLRRPVLEVDVGGAAPDEEENGAGKRRAGGS